MSKSKEADNETPHYEKGQFIEIGAHQPGGVHSLKHNAHYCGSHIGKIIKVDTFTLRSAKGFNLKFKCTDCDWVDVIQA